MTGRPLTSGDGHSPPVMARSGLPGMMNASRGREQSANAAVAATHTEVWLPFRLNIRAHISSAPAAEA